MQQYTRFTYLLAIFISCFCCCFVMPTSVAEQYRELNDLGYFITNDVYPIPQGEIMLTANPIYQQTRDGKIGQLFTAVQYGITPQWLISGGISAYGFSHINGASTATGNGDSFLATKYSFINIANSFTHVALVMFVIFPSGDANKDLGNGLIEYQPSISIAHDFQHATWTLQIFSEFGYSFAAHELQRPQTEEEDALPLPDTLFINLGYAIRTAKINYSVALNWQRTRLGMGDENQLYLTPGVFYLTPYNMELGISFPIGLTHDSDHFRVFAQVNYFFTA